jgi:hypothetical protein
MVSRPQQREVESGGMGAHLAAFMTSTPSPSANSCSVAGNDTCHERAKTVIENGNKARAPLSPSVIKDKMAGGSPIAGSVLEGSPLFWTIDQVVEWLSDAGLGEYGHAFMGKGIDGASLLQLTSEQLSKQLTLSQPLHQLTFFNRRTKLHAECMRLAMDI